ncbi:hypothetical protein FZI91_18140 [Mycobacterium sp. CBMA271]|nr:hypothetical protein [Mycobacteroides sp. CBMA 271]
MFDVAPSLGDSRAVHQVLAPHKVTDYAGAPLHPPWWTNAKWPCDEQPHDLRIIESSLSV